MNPIYQIIEVILWTIVTIIILMVVVLGLAVYNYIKEWGFNE